MDNPVPVPVVGSVHRQKEESPAQAYQPDPVKCEPIEIHDDSFSFAWPEWTDHWLPESASRNLIRVLPRAEDRFRYGHDYEGEVLRSRTKLESMIDLFNKASKAGSKAEIVSLSPGYYIFNSNPFPVTLQDGRILPAAPKEIASMFRIYDPAYTMTHSGGGVKFASIMQNSEYAIQAPASVLVDAARAFVMNKSKQEDGEMETIAWSSRDPIQRTRYHKDPAFEILIAISSFAMAVSHFGPPAQGKWVNYVDCEETLAEPPHKKRVRSDFFTVA